MGLLCCLCVLTGLASASGQETASKDNGKTSDTRAQDKNRTGLSTDDELFRKLTGGDALKSKQQKNPLEEAIRGMREAQKRIDGKDAGVKTRALQQDVVKNLEQLIEAIKQQTQSRSSSGKSPKPENGDPKRQASNPPESNPGKNGTTRKDKSSESTEKPRDAENRQVAPLTSKRMGQDVWGHLPPALRQKLLNVYQDKYLPKYDDLVRRYFESLADEGRPTPLKK
jgi:hypothetical protein